MSENLENLTNQELKAYIKANRSDEVACQEAIALLLNRRKPDTPKYPYNLPAEEMEAIFREKLQSVDGLTG